MLDLSTIIQSSPVVVEGLTIMQDTGEMEQLLGIQDDATDKDTELDPGSFVLLMSEIMATMPVQNDEEVKESAQKIEDEAEGIDSVISSETNVAPMVARDVPVSEDTNNKENSTDNRPTQELQNNAKIPTQTPVNELELDKNVALTWIDAENFEPPQAVMQELVNNEQFTAEIKKMLSENDEPVESVLPKETSIKAPDASIKINAAPLMDSKQKELPANIPVIENKERLPVELMVKPSFMNVEHTSPAIEQKIEPQVTENNQINIQQNVSMTKENSAFSGAETPKSLEIPLDIDSPQWNKQFSEHIVWLGHQGIKSAVIKLHPDDLGPLEISVKVDKNAASINIISQNSHVRDMVDQALPKLREMMTEQGLNLAEVHVGAEGSARHFGQSNQDSGGQVIHSFEELEQTTAVTTKLPKGLIDYFA